MSGNDPISSIPGTDKADTHEGITLFGWQFTANFRCDLGDTNPFAHRAWRNFDLINISVESGTYTGRYFEIACIILMTGVYIDIYHRETRKAFSDKMNAIRDEVIKAKGEE